MSDELFATVGRGFGKMVSYAAAGVVGLALTPGLALAATIDKHLGDDKGSSFAQVFAEVTAGVQEGTEAFMVPVCAEVAKVAGPVLVKKGATELEKALSGEGKTKLGECACHKKPEPKKREREE